MNAKTQVEELMNELLFFAEKMLAEHGSFHPFGGYLNLSAKPVHVGVQPNAEQASANGRVEILIDSFRRLATQKKAIAFAIASDVTLPYDDGSQSAAIKFLLEHRTGYCAEVFFRYELRDGVVEITDTIAQQGDLTFFGA